MEVVNFEKVFEDLKTIQSKVVPKAKYEDSQNEIEKLKSLLKYANGQVRGLVDELQTVRTRLEREKGELNKKLKMANCEADLILKEMDKLKVQHEEQKLKFDVVEAEKKRLEAVANNWEASYNEMYLKLKLKNHQLNSLSSEGRKNKAVEGQKCSIGTQTIKKEPASISAVNNPSSFSGSQTSADIQNLSTVQNSSTATNSLQQNSRSSAVYSSSMEACFKIQAGLRIKRKRFESEGQERKSKRINNQKFFNCEHCSYEWSTKFGEQMQQKRRLKEDIQTLDSKPGPFECISTFSTLWELKSHIVEVHGWSYDEFCKEKSCLQHKEHTEREHYSKGSLRGSYILHGDLACDTCEVTFECKYDLASHVKLIHGNIAQMSTFEVWNLSRD